MEQESFCLILRLLLLICFPNFSCVHFEDTFLSHLCQASAIPALQAAIDSDFLETQAEGKENSKCSKITGHHNF